MDRMVYGAGKPRTAKYKLAPPPLSGTAVERPRLIAALESAYSADNHTFAMLSAPAGYGKTSLLAQWAARTSDRGAPTAWCGLTIDDRHPVVLWTTVLDSLIEAVDGGEPELRDNIAELSPSMDARQHSLFIAQLYEHLAEFGHPIALLFDDVHLLENSPAEEEFIRLIEGIPSNAKIAFATRSPLATQSARINGRLAELTADSLSFTRAEAMELFTRCGAESADIEDLYAAVEGWPAALSLATLSVERMNDDQTKSLDWDDESVLYAYLEREVLDDLSDDERQVVLTFGITPMATANLIDAVEETTQSGRILRKLSLGDGIIHRVSTDVTGRTWYRVQPLFGAFLLEELRESDSSRIPEMAARAAEWHLEHGSALSAVQLALEPPNPELVDRVLRRRGYEIVNDGHSIELLEIVPPSTSPAIGAPFARLMTAYAAVAAGRLDRSAEFLSAPRIAELSADDLLEWDWLHYLVQVQTAAASGADIHALSPGWAESTFSELPDQLRLAIRRARGWEAIRVGHAATATSDLRIALAIAENQDDLASMIMSVVGLASAAATEFDVRSAQALSERALELASRSTGQRQSVTLSMAHSIAGWSAMELLEVQSARKHAQAAIDLAGGATDDRAKELAALVFNDVNFHELQEKRRLAQEFTTAWPTPLVAASSTNFAVLSLHAGLRMASYLGEWRWSERLLDRARQMLGESFDWQVAYALYLLNSSRPELARSVLDPLLQNDHPERFAVSDIIGWSMQAVLDVGSHNSYRAHSAIYRALERADETGGFCEVTRADQKVIAELLSSGSGRFGPHEHVARALLSGQVGASALEAGPLTERERQILVELTTLRTVQEIAHDMLLSVNTVKTHMRGVYRKLDVKSRRQAVAKAERLGLL